MNGPRLTEERLRYHLDSNQVQRERLCLALMPVLGPYTRERARRPKGGPDGGRDIEAVFEGSIVVWGAVGFRNGGGNDDAARREATAKFNADLKRALAENPSLQGFVFFANVDLTPRIVEELKATAAARGVTVVDICDMERLRHALDSPEGLIARLQYLDIPMSPTEQIALVNKFGSQLQNAVTARFDRVERTLAQMEQFLDLQRPVSRFDSRVRLNGSFCSEEVGDEAILMQITGLQGMQRNWYCLCKNETMHKYSKTHIVTQPYVWLGEENRKVTRTNTSVSQERSLLTVFLELTLSTWGHPVRLFDVSRVSLTAYATQGLYRLMDRVMLDANGYELFDCPIAVRTDPTSVDLPDNTSDDLGRKTWFNAVGPVQRDLISQPLRLSGRHCQLQRV